MDVTCDRCKAEYEFDEALLGERGTTVKCSACGHVFRVLPPSRDAVRSHLQLRYARDGSVRALSSLRELQQRIRAGEVSLDDELGRDGFPFRALRDVPELKNFFLSQPGRQERSTVRPEGTYPRQDAASTHMPVHPESISPGPEELGSEELGSEHLESDQPEAPTIPPPLPGSPEREAAEARRRAAAERAEQAVAEQRAANAGRTIPAPAGIPPEQRPRSFRQGTMSGVGPEGQLPPPPRMPEFAARTRSEPVPATPAPTAPVANPHASKLPPPGTGTVTGLPSMKPHQTLYGTPSGLPSSSDGTPTHGMQPGSTHPLANRLGSERPPAGERAPSGQTKLPSGQTGLPSGQTKLPSGQTAIPRGGERPPVPPVDEVALPKPLVEPDRFPQFKPVPSPIPPAPGSKPPPRKLYLDADEKPPPRATEGSRAWLYVALLLLAAGGGGWFGMTRMRVSGKARLEPNPATIAGPSNLEASGTSEAAVAEAQPTDQPASNAGPTGAAPFAPPIPELQEELERRTGDKPEGMANEPKAKPSDPAAAKAEPAKSEPTKPAVKAETAAKQEPVAKMEPAGKAEPAAKQAPPATMEPANQASPGKPAAAAAGAKSDRLARAERAVATNPKDYGAQLNLADALFAKGDNTAAVEAYRQALALRPTGSEANSGMGFALLKEGKASDSLPYFDRAANSGYAEASVGLGDAYRTLGQPSSAKEAYQAYLDRLPTGARATYARTWLDRLSGGGGSKTPERGAEPEPYRPAGELTSPPQ
jgi:predicted Zn finger-like uncharacterized protein